MSCATQNRQPVTPKRWPTFAVMSVATVLAVSGSAWAEKADAKNTHPGYVDGSTLAKLADGNAYSGELVEVTLGKSMLKALAKAFGRQDKGLAAFLRGLDSIEAVISTGSNSPAAEREMERLAGELKDRGWERMARVREDGQTVSVYAHTTQEELDGLTVFIRNPLEQELVFVNIAGKIDLGMMPLVGTSLQIPGLSLGAQAIEKERAAKKNDTGADKSGDEGGSR